MSPHSGSANAINWKRPTRAGRLAGATSTTPRCTGEEGRAMVQYSAKLICGRSDGTVAAPGEYWTAVNVHNPGSTGVQFRKKFVVSPPEPPDGTPPQPPTRVLPASLGPDGTFEIDRREVLD